MVGETNRLPFDLPEGEGEIVGGFHTEYSSLKFALFYLAEYINMTTVAALATTLFLGGWRAVWPITAIWSGANSGWWPVLWFLVKVLILLFAFVWLRGSLPRVRYDQLMRLGWKVLIPIALAWILSIAAIRSIQRTSGSPVPYSDRRRRLRHPFRRVVGLGRRECSDGARPRRKQHAADDAALRADPMAAGFPVPPLDLPHYHGVGVPPSPGVGVPQAAAPGRPARAAAARQRAVQLRR